MTKKKKEARYQIITQLCSMLRMSWTRSAYPFIVPTKASDMRFGLILLVGRKRKRVEENGRTVEERKCQEEN